jgi:hypothetical protein
MKPHKHAELIKAWADGAEIEIELLIGASLKPEWYEDGSPEWHKDRKYRIKPEPKTDIVKAFMLESHPLCGLRFYDATGFSREKDEQRILVTFDGETGELKSAEVLK